MGTKTIKITIPEYLSVDKFQQLQNLEHLTELNRVIKVISIIGGIEVDEIKTWMPDDIKMVYQDVIKCMDHGESFYPIFESADGILYGYSNLNEMTLGEFTDLERLCEKPNENLHEIMAILYRPISKHRFKDFSWKVKHQFKINTRKIDNVFKYYDLEKYDSKERVANADNLKEIPVQFALGALGFFLGTGNGYLNITTPSSTQKEEKKAQMMDRMILKALVNIGGGLRQYIHSPKRVFSLSQEKRVSLT
jgi:hypothetical protein